MPKWTRQNQITDMLWRGHETLSLVITKTFAIAQIRKNTAIQHVGTYILEGESIVHSTRTYTRTAGSLAIQPQRAKMYALECR